MKKFGAVAFLMLGLLGCMGTKAVKSTHPSWVPDERPAVFCKVVRDPDPLLIGTWECSFRRDYEEQPNHVKYALIKYEDKYALYQQRIWKGGEKRKIGWRAWIINGSQIVGVPEKYGVRLFVQDGDVYFTIRGLSKPVKMKRVE